MVRLSFPPRFNCRVFFWIVSPEVYLDACSGPNFWGVFQLYKLFSTLDAAHNHRNV